MNSMRDERARAQHATIGYRFIALGQRINHFLVFFLPLHLRTNHQKPQDNYGDQHNDKRRHPRLLRSAGDLGIGIVD